MKILQILLKWWFSYRLSPRRIDQGLRRRSANCADGKCPQAAVLPDRSPSDRSPSDKSPSQKVEAQGSLRKFGVSCVQRTIQPVKNVDAYIAIMEKFIQEAVEQGSQLVIFPEYNFLDLLGLIPGFELINQRLKKNAMAQTVKPNSHAEDAVSADFGAVADVAAEIDVEAVAGGVAGGTKIADTEAIEMRQPEGLSPLVIFSAIANPVQRALDRIFAELAMRHGIYIYTGSYVLLEDGQLYNAGSIFAPDGQKVGTQKKLHLTDFESNFGMARGKELHVYDLPICKAVAPICMDATYYETFKLARNLGAELVILPIANPEEYVVWKALKGLWPRVQEAYLFGAKAALTGWFAGMHYTGKAGIFAPLEMTSGRDGVVALAAEFEGNQLVTAQLDFAQLAQARASAQYFGDVNPEYESVYLKRTTR